MLTAFNAVWVYIDVVNRRPKDQCGDDVHVDGHFNIPEYMASPSRTDEERYYFENIWRKDSRK